ncbi:TRAP transporter substrate-binding protein DctP [Oceanimonas sp. CHS3-5]|uniref:TRAP transporter substrate-binding protein n=1 Tax=Oceanimonas sp. CHS3-5 TaxID=3068186 RepID=UPI00273FBF30|nr:TRAP transporter substrate-binding protein DctP [Oceanimonas sp. CHS3-5]MDP5293198.1 TRAP transporter substrate-binding protein DctP [Oceanimonas sp. CHS3-5]
MKATKTTLHTLALSTLLTLAPALVQAEEWKFAIEEIPGSIMDAYAQEFKKRIEAQTQGDVSVRIYHLGSLGTPTELVELAADGIIQFTNVSVGNLGTIVPESQIFLLPYAFPSDSAAMANFLDSSPLIHQELSQDYRQRGLEPLSFYSQGPQVWTTNKPIRTPDDFHNFKMRVMVSPILLKSYADLGASPTPVPFGEVYGALQLKQVDGQVNPIPAIEEMKFYEVTDYLIWAGEQELVTNVLAGSDWFDSLRPERQQLVKQTMAGLQGYIQNVVTSYNQEKLERIQQAKPGIELIRLTEAERASFKARTGHTHEAYTEITGQRGQQLLEQLQAELTTL